MAALLQLPECLLSEMETCKSRCADAVLGCQHESSPAWDTQLSQSSTQMTCWQRGRAAGSRGCCITRCSVPLCGHMHKGQQPQQLLSSECSMLPSLALSLAAQARRAAELCFHAVCLYCRQELQQPSVARCRGGGGGQKGNTSHFDSIFIYGSILNLFKTRKS